MRTRGRKSAAEIATLSVVRGGLGERPAPPDDLSDAEKTIWQRIVASEAPDFFRSETQKNLLKDLCRHRAAADALSAMLQKFRPELLIRDDIRGKYRELAKLRLDETRMATSLATKLRLTNQSRYTPQAAATAARNHTPIARPWER